jgi:hypothetical protein
VCSTGLFIDSDGKVKPNQFIMADERSRSTIVAVVTAVTALGAIALEVVSYAVLKRYASGLDSLPTVVMEEFPEITQELLDKFTSSDPDLGWSPQPNMEQQKDTGDHLPGEEVRSVVTYSTDEYGSRVCPAADRDPDSRERVTTYGDSYCFCREVNDDETFQHYLAEELDSHVGNYGGGNYGLDQSLMRLKQCYPDDPADTVVMYVTASSIARILSVWKHYQEFGNVLAVKPRYTHENGSLDELETPINEKEDLLDLESQSNFLRSNDYHYEHWFKPHRATFPYATDLFRSTDTARYALYAALKDIEKQFETSLPVDADARQTQTVLRLEQQRVKYHEQLYDEYEDFFADIIGEFVSYAEEEDFTPVFVMVQQLRYARYEVDHGPIYGDMLDRLDEDYPELTTIHMADHLSFEGDDVESLYVQHGEGGHYSPETNEKIAEVLGEEIFEEESVSSAHSD